MAELSLHGYTAALNELTDESRMTDARLAEHIDALQTTWRSATEQKIGRQAEVAARLLVHFTYEAMMRHGASTEEIVTAQAPYHLVHEDEMVESFDVTPATR